MGYNRRAKALKEGAMRVMNEFNIRRVFIHFFFPDQEAIDDSSILELVEKTLDRKNPREWYYG